MQHFRNVWTTDFNGMPQHQCVTCEQIVVGLQGVIDHTCPICDLCKEIITKDNEGQSTEDTQMCLECCRKNQPTLEVDPWIDIGGEG